MKLQKKVFGIYLEFEIIKAFKQLCEKKCQSPSKVCKMLIQKYIEENGDVDV